MNMKKCSYLLLFLLVAFTMRAAEFSDGQLRLVLHERTGRFSLYHLDEALFSDVDPRTSYLSVLANNRFYKMGDAISFKPHLLEDKPSFVFESSFLAVTQDFEFIKAPNSSVANGIRITITIENKGDQIITSGARMLLDTNLSEKASGFSFNTNRRNFNSELLVSALDGDIYWSDKNSTTSLSGSIITDSPQDPDSVHIANWKKLNDASWKASFNEGKDFSLPPYSINDTAVCYYFEPRELGRGEKRSLGIMLAVNNEAMLNNYSAALPKEPIVDLARNFENAYTEEDLAALREIISKIDLYIAMGTATEEEMAAIEFALNRLRAKYGSFNWR